jgi:hypothetical protein
MSFTTKRAVQAVEKVKSVGFINLYLPKLNGKRLQVGFIRLEEGNANHEAIAAKCNSEGGLEALVAKLEFEFNPIDPNVEQSADLDL